MDENFLKRLIETFNVEAGEIIKTVSSGLIELEKNLPEAERNRLNEQIFMGVHSLKGAARSVNFLEVEALCQVMENIFDKIKRNKITISKKLFDLLHETLDLISSLISSSEEERIMVDIDDLIDKLTAAAGEYPVNSVKETIPIKEKQALPVSPPIPPELKRTKPVRETIRISAEKLDSLLLQSEEMLTSKLIINQKADELKNLAVQFRHWNREFNKIIPEIQDLKLQLDKKKVEEFNTNEKKLDKMSDFIFWNHEQVKVLESHLKSFITGFDTQKRQIGGMVDNLLEDVKKVLMLPFSTIMEIFPNMVRKISGEQGKVAELIIEGSETEIDKRILEEIKDPLTHILRNSIDHGLERPEERLKNNKPAAAVINVKISQFDNNQVEIIITDNGRGIDSEKVKKAAVKEGIISEQDAGKLTENDLISLIFQSGLSTNQVITDLSGRGLGLAIVKEKIEKLAGIISVATEPGKFSSFKIILPARIATFKGILVKAGGQVYVIPGGNIEKVLRIHSNQVQTIENIETIVYRDFNLALVDLADILEIRLDNNTGKNGYIPVLIINSAGKTIAIAVEEILDEQEILVKQFNKQLTRVRNISGATILGSGKVVPILNSGDLARSAIKLSPKSPLLEREGTLRENIETAKKYILVAEDSITSRMLIKNILEAGGYRVRTAIDGLEALRALQEEKFDLLVSDIEMPGMNGFELVSRVRSDKQTENLPAILITSLSSQEDRKRGIDAGANAYIVKSSFDQSNLLSIIDKFI
jgi:two-component system chemotaxis sensor kinase CheA